MSMIGLDTNVVIRYLVQYPPTQARKASEFIDSCIQSGKILWICQATLCEVFWVLKSCYELSKVELVSMLRLLLRARSIKIERDDIAYQALLDYEENSKIDFPDCLIGRQNAWFECQSTYTFDKNAAKRLPGQFKLIS